MDLCGTSSCVPVQHLVLAVCDVHHPILCRAVHLLVGHQEKRQRTPIVASTAPGKLLLLPIKCVEQPQMAIQDEKITHLTQTIMVIHFSLITRQILETLISTFRSH